MERYGFIVQTNKSVMLTGSASSGSSPCKTSRPDLVCFNYEKSFIATIEVCDKDMEYDVGEAEYKFVKGIKLGVNEEKDDEENTFQQIRGGGGQSHGMLHVINIINEPMLKVVEAYALSVFHKKNEVEVRKITTNFPAGTVTVQSGNDRLTIQDAYNILAAVLVE